MTASGPFSSGMASGSGESNCTARLGILMISY